MKKIKLSKITQRKGIFMKKLMIAFVSAICLICPIFASCSGNTIDARLLSSETNSSYLIVGVEIDSGFTGYIYEEDFTITNGNLRNPASAIHEQGASSLNYQVHVSGGGAMLYVYFDIQDYNPLKSLEIFFKGKKLVMGEYVSVEKW